MMSPLLLILTVVVVLFGGPHPVIGQITSGLQSILKNTHHSKEYGYPTDITRDLLPVRYVPMWLSSRDGLIRGPHGRSFAREL
jgi:hypothetical protein